MFGVGNRADIYGEDKHLKKSTEKNKLSSQVKLDQAQSDDDEEVFIDVDKVQEDDKKNKQVQVKESGAETSFSKYDAFKREPKFSGADSCPLFELLPLTQHAHPTIKIWSTTLLKNELLQYSGDPLLDFSLANFLDRISYKEPKSAEKLAKLRQSKQIRSADYEKPANQVQFKEGEEPETNRPDEQYMYKYLKEVKPKKKTKAGDDDI